VQPCNGFPPFSDWAHSSGAERKDQIPRYEAVTLMLKNNRAALGPKTTACIKPTQTADLRLESGAIG